MISIVVPVYNAEKYIKRCVDSILNQSYRDYELILIDDNSTDSSFLICKSYEQNNSRVKAYKNPRKGVASARNLGILSSHGELVVFLDSDDYLDSNVLELCANSVTDKNTLYQFGICKTNDSVVYYPQNFDATIHHMISNCIYLTDNRFGSFFRSACGKVFFAEIIKANHIEFPDDLYMGEDAIFVMNYLKYITKYHVVSQRGYFYYVNEESSTMRYKEDLLKQCELQLGYINVLREDLNGETEIGFINFVWWMFNILIDNSIHGLKQRKIKMSQITADAHCWYKKHYCFMTNKVNTDNIVEEYKRQYLMARRNNFLQLFMCRVIWKFKKKIRNC